MNNRKTNIVVLVGVLSALAFVLYFLEFPLAFLFPAFLKIDFSDVPAILGGIAAGPLVGTAIELIKNILHFLLISKEPMASGEIANFFAGTSFLIPVAIMIRSREKFSKWPYFILPYVVATLISTTIINIINYFVTLPLYGLESEARLPMIISSLIPFNILKGILVSAVTILLYSKLKGFISKYVR
ncbi:MAG TPA: ECF transporter S component [Clostridiaceae bacterium]|nr:ECF transporter S component [Clostridiaceae bacterium]